VLFSVYTNLAKKHKYAIAFDDPEYINVSNTLHAFRDLSVQSPHCFIRITAPFKNRGVAQVLTNLGGDFCRIDSSRNPAEPPDDILKGSVDNGIVIHMAKEPQTRDGFVVEMGNVFAVRRSYDLPPGSPPDLIWIQIGRGYPFKKDDGSSGDTDI
jgi:hypothetical protein